MKYNRVVVLIAVIVATLALSVGVGTVGAQDLGPEQFNETYGGPDNDRVRSMAQTQDGGYILAGETDSFGSGGSDAWLIKVDSEGNEQFNKTYGGAGGDVAYSVIETSDGGYALAGLTESFGPTSGFRDSNAWLIKTDETGTEQFNTTYGGLFSDAVVSIVETSDGGFALAGLTVSFGSGDSDAWLIKTDETGTEQFNETYGGLDPDTAFTLVETSDGGFALAGRTESFGSGDNNAWLIKTDEKGDEQFNETYDVSLNSFIELISPEAPSIIQTSDKGYALGGITDSFSSGASDAYLIKTDEDGNEQFNKTYGGAQEDFGTSVVETQDGFVLGGATTSFGSIDAWVVSTDKNGDERFNETYESGSVISSGIRTSDGGFAFAGIAGIGSTGPVDAWLTKIEGTDTGTETDKRRDRRDLSRGEDSDIDRRRDYGRGGGRDRNTRRDRGRSR